MDTKPKFLKPPCYNRETKTDCPNRKDGCRSDCEKWQEFEKDNALAREYRRKCSEHNGLFWNKRIEKYLYGHNQDRCRTNQKRYRKD